MKHWFAGVAVLLLAMLVPVASGPSAGAQNAGSGEFTVRLLHLVPPGVTPRHADMADRIPATFDAIQVFLQQHLGRTLRVTPGVTRVEVARNNLFAVQDEMMTQGYDDLDTIYVIFAEFEDDGACGSTLQRYQDEPAYAFILMPACGGIYPAPAADALWPYDATFLVLHELLHGMGAVPSCAPNYTAFAHGHVDDSTSDILGLGPRTLDDFLNLSIDVNNDDYYGHNNRDCPDLIASPYWASPAPPGAYCRGSRVTINMNLGAPGIGTPGNDVILGTAGRDVIEGRGGNDIICAGPGDDSVDGGTGNDRIFGAQGADDLRGGDGNDTIHGNLGPDRLDGGTGQDRLFGYADDDTLFGGPGDDRLHGNVGDDELRGGSGDDLLFGYAGDDTISGGPGADLIRGNFGDDVLDGKEGRDEIYGSGGDDVLLGGDGNDVLEGNSDDDTLRGGDGFDRLDGGIGVDACDGGSQTDRANRCEVADSIP